MSADFRLAADFLAHHKIRRLRTRLGADGVLAWLQLIGYAAANRPDGRLTGLTDRDIAEVACWEGSEDFTRTLIDLQLLDQHRKIHVLHNWAKRQPWIVSSDKRRAKAQKAAQKRWENPKQTHPRRMLRACHKHRLKMLLGMPPTQPNPTQPKEKRANYLIWFEEVFTPNYPSHRQVQQPTARTELKSLKPDPQMCSEIMKSLERWKDSHEWTKDDGAFVPGMGKFFKDGWYKRQPASANGNNGKPTEPTAQVPTADQYYRSGAPDVISAAPEKSLVQQGEFGAFDSTLTQLDRRQG